MKNEPCSRFVHGHRPVERARRLAVSIAAASIAFLAAFSPVRPGTALAGDGTCGEASAEGSTTWYFAEGYTGEGFETWVLLANPGDFQASAVVSLILEDGTVTPVGFPLPPHSRRTVFVNGVVGEGRDVSARVEADAPVCAERVMYFDYHGVWPGGHASSGLSRPRQTYLFA